MPAAAPLLLLLLLNTDTYASDSDDLRGVISDLNGQRHPPAVNHPCHAPGITCEAVMGASLHATRIVLASHHLNGFISPAIGRLSELRELSLPNNRLSGAVPRELAGCPALEILDLRSNRLSGEVPREVASLAALRVLDLSSNGFSGDLGFLNHLPNLEKLYLSDNFFSGRIPRSLPSFRNLLFLDLSGNPDLISGVPRPAAEYPLRRSLLPRRNMLAGISNSTRNHIPLAAAPAPSPSAAHHQRRTRHRVRNWVIGFVAGSIGGVVSGLVLSVLFRMLMNCIRGRYKDPTGPCIFSPLIKSPEDLAFLEKEDGLAALEVIGRGGCGEVYRAQLPGDPVKTVAIKKIKKRTAADADPTDDESRFLDKWMRQIQSELRTVGHVRHRNLLPLLAHVSRPDCHYLIYEYMKNGSLHDVLAQGRELDWEGRHKVARGIAAGLEYLHHHHKPHIIHRDLKPGNILLDDDMEPRISDFGLAKEVPDAHTHMSTSNVAGTVGYIAPEYYQTLKFTAKCDVYSLGVILAVLVVGKLPSDDFFQETEEMSLVKWVRNMMGSAEPAAAIDPRLVGQGFEQQMLLVLRIACFCTADDPHERPTSKDVRCMLAQII